MSMRLWMNAVLAGSLAGIIAGFVGGDLSGGLIYGGAISGVTSLAGGHIFRGDDDSSENAFMASIPYSGFLGGLGAALVTEAGFLGAFLGAGIGFASGPFIGLMLYDDVDKL